MKLFKAQDDSFVKEVGSFADASKVILEDELTGRWVIKEGSKEFVLSAADLISAIEGEWE